MRALLLLLQRCGGRSLAHSSRTGHTPAHMRALLASACARRPTVASSPRAHDI